MQTAKRKRAQRIVLHCEKLEDRSVPATVSLAGGVLTINGTAGDDRIRVSGDGTNINVLDGTTVIGSFASSAVTSIVVNSDAGNDTVIVDPNLTQPTTFTDPADRNKLVAGGGNTTFNTGTGRDFLFGSTTAPNTFNGDGGANDIFSAMPTDNITVNPNDRLLVALPVQGLPNQPQQTITADEVNALLQRAAAASASNDAIIVICDRNGRIIGVRVEGGVNPAITSDISNLVFAVDGAYAKALTGAYFGNNQAPLTSRTIQYISQSTITEREVNSNPSITDPNSTVRGPGFVAPVGIKGHFPPNVPFTPQVDLFQIEHTNRDGLMQAGPDNIVGTGDDIPLGQRFNLDPNFIPNSPNGNGPGGRNDLFAPSSFGVQSGLLPTAQSRGIGTLPGGIPIFKNGQVVGGIGVFFPGATGYATEENSRLSTTFNPLLPDRSLEAEYIAFAALGGTRLPVGNVDSTMLLPINDIGGVALPPGFGLPAGRVDLVGIQLDVFGPGGLVEGTRALQAVGQIVGVGDPNSGTNLALPGAGANNTLAGQTVPDGWLVVPHDGAGITAAEATSIIIAGLNQASTTRAAIRLPFGTRAKFVLAVADQNGEIVALFRQPDATIFSIDVAVAKARNVAYYANPTQLQSADYLPGVAPGFALTNRSIRFLGEPRFPEGIDGAPPGPFSQLNDDPLGTDRFTGRLIGAPLPASAYNSVVGFDAFNPGTNFHSISNLQNRNGIVFFPGSSPLYRYTGGLAGLIGGFGVSGDGVDQDDVTTVAGQSGFVTPFPLRIDQVLINGVRIPYQKFNRNPEG